MDDNTLRVACLKAASRFAISPADLMRISLAFEGYVIGGYNIGISFLRSGPPAGEQVSTPEPATPAEPEPDAIDHQLDRMEQRTEAVTAADAVPSDKLN
jgi:hypothetical protein